MSHFVNAGASTFRPWHYAETSDVWGTLTGRESGAEVQRIARMDYTMRKAPLYCEGHPLARAYGIVRSDGTLVGNAEHGHPTVGEDFELFQPGEMFGFTDALREVDSEVRYLSAGTLKGGRILWTLADAGSMLQLRRPNGMVREHRKGLFIYNPCDGSGRLTVRFTDIDVCCWNTASAAMRENTAATWSTKHTSGMRSRLADAAAALDLASVGFREAASVWQLLNGLDMGTLYQQRSNAGGMLVFSAQLATGIDDAAEAVEAFEKSARTAGRSGTLLRNRVDALLGLFARGIGATGTDAVDALSAVTEYVDHAHGRSAKWRERAQRLGIGMDSAQLGTGADFKRRAARLLLQRATS
jgi:hypothetical protein